MSGPGGIHVCIEAFQTKELLVGAQFDDATIVKHRDPVGLHGRTQAVGDDNSRTAFQQHVQGVFDLYSEARSRFEVASSSRITLGLARKALAKANSCR